MQNSFHDPLGRLRAAKELAHWLSGEPARLKAPLKSNFGNAISEKLLQTPLATLAADYLHMQELYMCAFIEALPEHVPDNVIRSLPELMLLPATDRENDKKGKHFNIMLKLAGMLRKVAGQDAQPEDWQRLRTALKPFIHWLDWAVEREKESIYRPENAEGYAIAKGIRSFQKADMPIGEAENLEFVGRNSPSLPGQEELKRLFSDVSRLSEHIAMEMLANLKELDRLLEKPPLSRKRE